MARRGFTLIELLIFSALFAVVMGGVITIFISTLRVQSRQSTASEVQSQGQFLLQQIQYYVQSARLVDMTQDVATGTLVLREANLANDPAYINASSGVVYLQQGASGTPSALTSNKVLVSNLSFARHFNLNGSSTAYGTDSVSYSFTLSGNTSNTTQQYTQSFQSSAAVLAPVGKIAMIQQAATSSAGNGYTSVSLPFTTANETGSLLLAFVSNTGGSTDTLSVHDSAGNSWSQVAGVAYTALAQKMALFAAVNATSAVNTVTATSSFAISNPSLFIYEYRGAATSSSFDASSVATTSNSAAPSSGSANPTSTVELIFGGLYSNPSTEIPAAGTGYLLETTSTLMPTYAEDMNLYVTGPVSANWSYSVTTPSSSALVATFK